MFATFFYIKDADASFQQPVDEFMIENIYFEESMEFLKTMNMEMQLMKAVGGWRSRWRSRQRKGYPGGGRGRGAVQPQAAHGAVGGDPGGRVRRQILGGTCRENERG